jgi:hypothetical protein
MDRSMHAPEGKRVRAVDDYDPTGVDTRYDRPHPNSILGRAATEGDLDTLGRIAVGRMREEQGLL